MNIIAADVGGTKTRIICADAQAPDHVLYDARYESNAYSSFEPLLETFLRDSGSSTADVETLALALPGLVNDTQARLTNLPWVIDKQSLMKRFGIRHVRFMNDFQASASGTSRMKEGDIIVLNRGDREAATIKDNSIRVALGAGTGLGIAWAKDDNGVSRSFDSEGGHIDFAPVDDLQIELLRYLKRQHEHVSFERILSGSGLSAVYSFLHEYQGRGALDEAKTAEWVSTHTHENETASEAVSLFVQIYGTYVGNVALTFKPFGGIFITGGMAAKMADAMCTDQFLDAYLDKGRMRALMEQITVNLVTNEDIGVLGALHEASMYQSPEAVYQAIKQA